MDVNEGSSAVRHWATLLATTGQVRDRHWQDLMAPTLQQMNQIMK